MQLLFERMNLLPSIYIASTLKITRGGGTSFFPVKHEKFPLSYIPDAKNFSVVKPLNSGEAVASPASPVPPPLVRINVDPVHNICFYKKCPSNKIFLFLIRF